MAALGLGVVAQTLVLTFLALLLPSHASTAPQPLSPSSNFSPAGCAPLFRCRRPAHLGFQLSVPLLHSQSANHRSLCGQQLGSFRLCQQPVSGLGVSRSRPGLGVRCLRGSSDSSDPDEARRLLASKLTQQLKEAEQRIREQHAAAIERREEKRKERLQQTAPSASGRRNVRIPQPSDLVVPSPKDLDDGAKAESLWHLLPGNIREGDCYLCNCPVDKFRLVCVT